MTGYLAGCGSALAVAALHIRRPPRPARPALTSVGGAALLAVVALAVVVLPVHVGLTSVAPHGPDWWVIAVLALAVVALLAGAHALLPTPWSYGAVLALCLPMPVASLIGVAPGFLALISPLIMVLIVLHLAVCAAAGRPRWRTIAAGALTGVAEDWFTSMMHVANRVGVPGHGDRPPIEVDIDPAGPDPDEPVVNIDVGLSSDIWLPWNPSTYAGAGTLDKRLLATRNAPRLNAILTELHAATLLLGGTWQVEPLFATGLRAADDNGIVMS